MLLWAQWIEAEIFAVATCCLSIMSLSFWHTDLFIFVFPWVKNKLEYESKPFGDYWPFVFAQMGCLLPNIAQVQVEKKCILFIILLLRAGRAYTEGQS